ncbi:MAG: malate dehydrogenase [Thermoprotei archaeon]|nr:MAG: malate dehydrogenase [Thermoprotei archaeon]
MTSMKIGIIGVGRVGSATAFSLLREEYVEELHLMDIVPQVLHAVAEELRHAAAALRRDIEIFEYEKAEEISGVDLFIITAGFPRKTAKISRRELAGKNAKIMKDLAETLPSRNPEARYVIVTNPVDAMASVFTKFSKENFVISTGNALDTARFKAEVAYHLKVPVTKVECYVVGEHGDSMVPLWSSVKVDDLSLEDYLKKTSKTIDKKLVSERVKTAGGRIISSIGGTSYGPAGAFTEIVRSIALNERKIISIATPYHDPNITEEPVHVSWPVVVGRSIGPRIEIEITDDEKAAFEEAVKAIWNTYKNALDYLTKEE